MPVSVIGDVKEIAELLEFPARKLNCDEVSYLEEKMSETGSDALAKDNKIYIIMSVLMTPIYLRWRVNFLRIKF